MHEILQQLLRAEPASRPIVGLKEWWTRHQEVRGAHELGYASALVAGFHSDRLGYAFASGYVEALSSVLDRDRSAPVPRRRALCATEEGGSHPRTIRSTLRSDGQGYRLSGTKSFVTLGSQADELLIVARLEAQGSPESAHPLLKIVHIPRDREGLHLRELPPISFVPEIPHASLEMHELRVAKEELLPGDGYLDYLKPFRTVEDLHVHGALFGYLLQIARRGDWPRDWLARLCHLVASGETLVRQPPLSPAVHVALAGLLSSARALVEEAEPYWSSLDESTRERWRRDRPLLEVAGTARSARLQAAWRDLSPRAVEPGAGDRSSR